MTNLNSSDDQKRHIKELLGQIDKIPDNDDSIGVKKLIGVLNSLLRIKGFIPPTIEIMCYIKLNKPALYHATRMGITTTSHLYLLFQLEADPELAMARLHEYLAD